MFFFLHHSWVPATHCKSPRRHAYFFGLRFNCNLSWTSPDTLTGRRTTGICTKRIPKQMVLLNHGGGFLDSKQVSAPEVYSYTARSTRSVFLFTPIAVRKQSKSYFPDAPTGLHKPVPPKFCVSTLCVFSIIFLYPWLVQLIYADTPRLHLHPKRVVSVVDVGIFQSHQALGCTRTDAGATRKSQK